MAMTQNQESHSWHITSEGRRNSVIAVCFSGNNISLTSSESEVQTQIPRKSGFSRIITQGSSWKGLNETLPPSLATRKCMNKGYQSQDKHCKILQMPCSFSASGLVDEELPKLNFTSQGSYL